MTDWTGTGDTHGMVAQLIEQHDSHHAGTTQMGQEVPPSWKNVLSAPPRCHATHAEMVGGVSDRTTNTVKRIIENAHLGTPVQALAAKSWLERNAAEDEKSSVSGHLGW